MPTQNVQRRLFAPPRRRPASADPIDRGAIFTQSAVVEFILDLVGYGTALDPLAVRLLEPSFGHGDFLLPVLDRLLAARDAAGDANPEVLRGAITGVELDPASHAVTAAAVRKRLRRAGLAAGDAEELTRTWLRCDDFLLTELDGPFDVVVGNPPYVRQERIGPDLLAEYRSRYRTLYDRADLYVPFFERCLGSLSESGRLGFICADRWMKNRYGGPLRRLIADRFRVDHLVDMTNVPAFRGKVTAYPAVTVISRGGSAPARVAGRPPGSLADLKPLAAAMTAKGRPDPATGVIETGSIAEGDAPWVSGCDGRVVLIRRLEAAFPTLEDAGCRVGIGVATGADRVFIGPLDELDVEEDRRLPLATTGDFRDGRLDWRGRGVVNPFGLDGRLVDLADFPRLAAHLERHREALVKRYVARKNPAQWYRTIDRIDPRLAGTPKLLIPDIRGATTIAHEPGRLYPHHNLYFVTSEEWDLHALRAVLSAGIAELFVAAYSTRMRGGYLRFQAQYLRRIPLPPWESLKPALRERLIVAGADGNHDAAHALTAEVYGLSAGEADRCLRGRA